MCIERKYLCWDPNSLFYKSATEGVSADLFPEAMFSCASVHTVKQTGGKQMKAANSTSSSQNAWPGVNLNYWDRTILDDHSDCFLNLKIPNKVSWLHSWESALLWSSCTVVLSTERGKYYWSVHTPYLTLGKSWCLFNLLWITCLYLNFLHSPAQILNFVTRKKTQRIIWLSNKKGDNKQYRFLGGLYLSKVSGGKRLKCFS